MLRRLFALPEQAKWDQAITRETYRGFIPMGFFTPNDGSGTADKYEGYKLHDETVPTDPVVRNAGFMGRPCGRMKSPKRATRSWPIGRRWTAF